MPDNNEQLPPENGGGDVAQSPVPPAPAPEPVMTEPFPRTAYADRVEPSRPRRAALWWGSLLIFAGALLLVSQFVPEVQAWRYWPLIIIAIGIRQMFGPAQGPWRLHHLGEGLSTIAIGAVFLGQMTGYLSWNVWLNVLSLWPLLLVSFGLEIIGKSIRSEFVRLLGSLVIVAGLIYGSYVMSPASRLVVPFGVAGESEEFDFEADAGKDVESGSARIQGAVGSLDVEAGDGIISARGVSPFDPIFETEYEGDKIEARAGLGEGSWWGPQEAESKLDVVLGRDIAWDLDIEAGVSEYDIDLRELHIASVVFEAGVSDGTLTLGESEGDEAVPVEIDTGVSSLTIRVPRDVATRVRVSAGLTGIEADGTWDEERDGDDKVFESDGFTDNAGYWDITIDAGVSGINIEYY